MATFELVPIEKILDFEGRYLENVKGDKGGITKWGITFKFYLATAALVLLDRTPTLEEFKGLEEQKLKAFYKFMWERCELDGIEQQEVANAIFDFLINSGKAAFVLQTLFNRYPYELGFKIGTDNLFRSQSVRAANILSRKIGKYELIAAVTTARKAYLEAFIKREPTQKKFWAGWLRRLMSWQPTEAQLAAEDATEKALKNSNNSSNTFSNEK